MKLKKIIQLVAVNSSAKYLSALTQYNPSRGGTSTKVTASPIRKPPNLVNS